MTVPREMAMRRFVLQHRRVLAAVFAGLGMLFALSALQPSTPGMTVVVASHDLASGTVIAASDVHTAKFPSDSKPDHSWSSATSLIGKRVAAPMRGGEVLTDYRLLEPGLLRGYDKTLVLAPVRVAESTQLAGLSVGDHVNIIGTDPQGENESTVIARRVEVLSLPSLGQGQDAPIVFVAVSEDVGLKLATAGLRARLSVLAVP